jgi:hypothetical protein
MACCITGRTLSIATRPDGGVSVSDHVFALMYLLGYCFAPRISNLAERQLYAFDPACNWPALTRLIGAESTKSSSPRTGMTCSA